MAVITVKPAVGSNGIIPAPKGFLQGVRDLCDKNAMNVVGDKTKTGMGHTIHPLAIENDGVAPDILITGKATVAYCPMADTILLNP